MKDAFERDSQELAREIELIEKETSHPKPYVIPKPFRTPTIILLLFIVTGAVLELTVGSGFIFAGADTYRSAAPWFFAALLPVFAVLLYWQERLSGNLRSSFPTSWLRRLIIFPLMVAVCSGIVLIAPLGWASLLGLAVGARADDLEGIVLSAGEFQRAHGHPVASKERRLPCEVRLPRFVWKVERLRHCRSKKALCCSAATYRASGFTLKVFGLSHEPSFGCSHCKAMVNLNQLRRAKKLT